MYRHECIFCGEVIIGDNKHCEWCQVNRDSYYRIDCRQTWEEFDSENPRKIASESFVKAITEDKDEALIVDGDNKEIQVVYYKQKEA